MEGSSRAEGSSVKGGRLTRHFAGWQPALLAVFLAGSAAVVAVPRSVEPTEIPLPRVDATQLRKVAAREHERAALAEEHGFDVEVGQLGSAVRDFGRIDAADVRDEGGLARAREKVAEALGRALSVGVEDVARLRAYHQRSFARELRRWEASGEASEELAELGGGIVHLLRDSGWVVERGGRRRVVLTGTELGVLFRKRWNAITGVSGPVFEPTVDEERALFRFLLEHPLDTSRQMLSGSAIRPSVRARFQDRYRLKKIDELGAIDPTYPAALARGVVQFRLGNYLLALDAFRRHLDAFPEGPHAVRAQNYLRAALERAVDEPR